MKQSILYFGQTMIVSCDEKCDKAWGINNRPKEQLNENDEDDFVWLSDDELGIAPNDPGTYEGGYAKPINKINIPNKWCVRECERCCKNNSIIDFTKRVYNIPRN